MKPTKYIFPLVAWTLLLAAAGCSKDSLSDRHNGPDDGTPSALVVTLDVRDLSVSLERSGAKTRVTGTRDLYYDSGDPYQTGDYCGLEQPDSDPSQWSELARLVDGRDVYRVTLFLVNYSQNRVVAYRDIYKGSPDLDAGSLVVDSDGREYKTGNGFLNSATNEIDLTLKTSDRVRITFDYNAPKHKAADGSSVERFSRGDYWLLAVANHTETDEYPGLTGLPDMIQKILDDFDPKEGLENFSPDYANFYDYVLQMPKNEASTGYKAGVQPYLRVRVPQVLTCAEEIHVVSGLNLISAELRRPCARIRFEVRNTSNFPLHIDAFSLSSNFTQRASYLFSHAPVDDNYNVDQIENITGDAFKGSPDVHHPYNAIVAFRPDLAGVNVASLDPATTRYFDGVVPAMPESIDEASQPPFYSRENYQQAIFDGLLYESRDLTNPYTYTITLGYDTGEKFRIGSATTSAASLSDGALFLIGYPLMGANYRFWYDDGTSSSIQTAYTTVDVLSEGEFENYIWRLKASGSGYLIQNYKTGRYINDYVTLVSSQNSAQSYSVEDGLRFYYSYYSWGAWYPYYIYYDGSGLTYNRGSASNFTLFPITEGDNMRKTETVTLTTYDSQTAMLKTVNEIKRNDFIRVLLEVSYNPDKNDIDFYVKPWDTGGGDIEFN